MLTKHLSKPHGGGHSRAYGNTEGPSRYIDCEEFIAAIAVALHGSVTEKLMCSRGSLLDPGGQGGMQAGQMYRCRFLPVNTNSVCVDFVN